MNTFDEPPNECRVHVCQDCGSYRGPLGDWFEAPTRPWAKGQTVATNCPRCVSVLEKNWGKITKSWEKWRVS